MGTESTAQLGPRVVGSLGQGPNKTPGGTYYQFYMRGGELGTWVLHYSAKTPTTRGWGKLSV
jgi:hypothetical protein